MPASRGKDAPAKIHVMLLALALFSILLSLPYAKAFAHGPPPGSCGNEYAYTLKSFTINNGVHTFDMLANPDLIFNALTSRGYDVTFTVHTASQSTQGNTQPGTFWYNHDAFGFGQGNCVSDVGPDQDKTVTVHVGTTRSSVNGEVSGYNRWNMGYFGSSSVKTITYGVSWYTSSNYPLDTGKSSVTIVAIDYNSTDWNNNKINGMYINLTQNGQLVDYGFTPATFTLNNGQVYQFMAANYGPYYFHHWSLEHGREPQMSIKIAESTSFTQYAYYYTKAPPPSSTGQSSLNVATVDSNDSPINGYYTVLSQNGAVVDTKFSPAAFKLNNGQQYSVSVADYGQYIFDHWKDTGSTVRDRPISISADKQIVAVYRNINSPQPSPTPAPAPSGQSSLTVRTENLQGSEIPGYYTTIAKNGAVVGTGFSPKTFTINTGEHYTVSVSDYGQHVFDHWKDSGGTTRERNIVFVNDGSDTLTAIYRNINEQPQPQPTPQPQPNPPSSSTTITISTVNSAGNPITGYYTTLWQNGAMLQSGFSPATFTVSTGQAYQVAVADYGNYVFDHWSDESTNRFHDAVAGDSLVAVYRNS